MVIGLLSVRPAKMVQVLGEKRILEASQEVVGSLSL